MLAELVACLRCPVCAGSLHRSGTGLRCPEGHSFDLARQGYVNLLAGRAPAVTDTSPMVAARAALLDAEVFAPLRDAVAEASVAAAAAGRAGLVLDCGAGTGYYLAAVLDRLPAHHGLALDLSKAAVRLAARAHPRAGAVVCDVWRRLPVADAVADVVLNVFAPRNPAEFRRVLQPRGQVLTVTPAPDHLAELVRSLGLLRVDPHKAERLDAGLGQALRLTDRHRYAYPMTLTREQAHSLVAMGPSAWHTDPAALAARLDRLEPTISVQVSVELRTYAAPA